MSRSIENQFSRGFAWMAAGSLVEQALNAAVFLLLARLLNPEAFGIWAMAAALLLLGETLVRETLADFLIAADYETEGLRSTVFWCLITLGAAVGISLAAISGPLARFYDEPTVAPILLGIAPIPLLVASSAVPTAMLRRAMQFRALSLRAIAGMAAGGIVGLVLALAGYGVWALVAQRVALALVNAVAPWFAVAWRPRLRFDTHLLDPVLGFGRGVVSLRLAELSVVQLPSIAIGALQGPVMLGYFSIAWRLTELSSFLITTPLRMAAQSAFAAMNRGAQGAAALLVDLSKLSSLVALPAFAGLAVLSWPFVMVLAGRGWGPAAPALSVLAIYGAWLCIAKLYQSFVLARARPRALALIQWGEVALAVTLIALFGNDTPTHAASALLAAIVAFAPLRVRSVAREGRVPVSSLLAPLLVPALGAAFMAVAVLGLDSALIDERPITRVLAGASLGVAIYAGWAALFLRDRVGLFIDRFGPRSPLPAGSPGGRGE